MSTDEWITVAPAPKKVAKKTTEKPKSGDKTTPCTNFFGDEGKCLYGKKCHFSHDPNGRDSAGKIEKKPNPGYKTAPCTNFLVLRARANALTATSATSLMIPRFTKLGLRKRAPVSGLQSNLKRLLRTCIPDARRIQLHSLRVERSFADVATKWWPSCVDVTTFRRGSNAFAHSSFWASTKMVWKFTTALKRPVDVVPSRRRTRQRRCPHWLQ